MWSVMCCACATCGRCHIDLKRHWNASSLLLLLVASWNICILMLHSCWSFEQQADNAGSKNSVSWRPLHVALRYRQPEFAFFRSSRHTRLLREERIVAPGFLPMGVCLWVHLETALSFFRKCFLDWRKGSIPSAGSLWFLGLNALNLH